MMSGDALATVQTSLQQNAYMAHPENILLGMLGDTEQGVRAEAVDVIQACRKHHQRSQGKVREFPRPYLNLDATNYTELVNIHDSMAETDIEPPCVKSMTKKQLQDLIRMPMKTQIPNHTQSTEREVKLTTEAAARVMGTKRQDGVSLNKIAFRRRFK